MQKEVMYTIEETEGKYFGLLISLLKVFFKWHLRILSKGTGQVYI